MALQERFGEGLQHARKSRGLTQEDFSMVSSRTYLSSLERGLKSPTIEKVAQLASVMEIHPLALLALAYLPKETNDPDALLAQISADIRSLKKSKLTWRKL
jgi:transcriptional regulator with XRE-family HTH domain